MSHWPQSVNEPADLCNKLLGRTAELEICRHSQNQKKEGEGQKENRSEGKEEEGCKERGQRLFEWLSKPATAVSRAEF